MTFQYDLNRLKGLYFNTNKTNDALSLLFILPFTHPHLNAAYHVCGGQRSATESGDRFPWRRWLEDFRVTLYQTLLTVRVVTRVTSILVHCLSMAFLSCPCSGQNRPKGPQAGVRNREYFKWLWRLLQREDNTFRLRLRVKFPVALTPVAPALGQHPWIRGNCILYKALAPILDPEKCLGSGSGFKLKIISSRPRLWLMANCSDSGGYSYGSGSASLVLS